MATLQERLQMKRVPIDKWSIKEQLCLASAVSRSGDQNWMSVSRALKPFAEPNRPPDWFSQKNCAAQYGLLLENVETPKRKKRVSGSVSDVIETPQEIILKKLTDARKAELSKKMEDERREYLKITGEMEMIRNDTATDEMIEQWSKEIEEEEKQKAQDAIAHAQWLKQREERKLEVERAFRPLLKVTTTSPGQKRKASESIDSIETIEESSTSETSKPALSPLLTSLLKTPAHVPNVTSSILHSAITNQRGTSTSPTIASLLNTTTSVPVSPSLQQLVSTAISQEPTSTPQQLQIKTEPTEIDTNTDKNDPVKQVADEISLLESSKTDKNVVQMNNDEVLEFTNINVNTNSNTNNNKKDELKTETPIIEELIIKNEPMDIEDKPLSESSEIEIKIEATEDPVIEEVQEQLDVYDFDNNSKTSSEEITSKDTNTDTTEPENDESNDKTTEPEIPTIEIKNEPLSPEPKSKKEIPGSVEIVEVVMDDDDSDKEMNKKVSEIKRDMIQNKDKLKEQENALKETIYSPKEKKQLEEKSPKKETTVYDEYDFDDLKKPDDKSNEEKTSNIDLEVDVSRKSTFTPELDTFYDDLNIEVTKLDKSGKAKRDYSRTKKKEDKEIDILLAVEKVVNTDLEENDAMEETSSEKDSQDSDKKSDLLFPDKIKLKDNERSNSPWTEEEIETLPKTRRRLSGTPATPNDSIPNSPASGVGFEDDRDYRTWKKSVMLVYNRLVTHKCASLFLKPITDEQAPGYHSVVYRPMDLQTIRKNIENGVIRTTAEFQRDVLLMFNNAIMYNPRTEMVYQMAQQMQREGLEQIQILLQAQTQVETPARRETRTSESGLKRKRGQDELMVKNKKRRDE